MFTYDMYLSNILKLYKYINIKCLIFINHIILSIENFNYYTILLFYLNKYKINYYDKH